MARRPAGQTSTGKLSAGLLLFRRTRGALEVFLAHPGGPFWKHRDEGAWTIPKGLVEPGEERLDAARREFEEETGIAPAGPFLPLGSVTQKAGKTIHAWAWEGDADPEAVKSNVVPVQGGDPRQGFPEIDRCEWFAAEVARQKLNPAQAAFIDRLEEALRQERQL
jgi:predicted NUDIX family NTP pyrophosphohydrolase